MKKTKKMVIREVKNDIREFARSKNGTCRCINVLNYCIGRFTAAGSVPVEVLDYINNLADEGCIRY